MACYLINRSSWASCWNSKLKHVSRSNRETSWSKVIQVNVEPWLVSNNYVGLESRVEPDSKIELWWSTKLLSCMWLRAPSDQATRKIRYKNLATYAYLSSYRDLSTFRETIAILKMHPYTPIDTHIQITLDHIMCCFFPSRKLSYFSFTLPTSALTHFKFPYSSSSFL